MRAEAFNINNKCLALTAHARATSHWQLVSSFTFKKASLWNSVIPFAYSITPW